MLLVNEIVVEHESSVFHFSEETENLCHETTRYIPTEQKMSSPGIEPE